MTQIVLYGYPTSPYYQKVILVLNFLKLPFSLCAQPRQLPRPDFASVGINYRRIPLLSIDGHMYADTNLIIDKLCALAGVPNHRETEWLGNAMFLYCAMLIPYKLIADPAFLKDRSELTGRPWTEEGIKKQRPYALSQFLAHLDVIQQLLKNGGGFVRDGKVTMADLHLAFVVQWPLLGHKGAEPEVSRESHPSVYKWLAAVHGAIASQKPAKVSFADCRAALTSVSVDGSRLHDKAEPLGLQPGTASTVSPVDTGKNHPQPGELVYINAAEVCLRTSGGVVISFPRINYTIAPAGRGKM